MDDRTLLTKLAAREDLTAEEVRSAMERLMAGEMPEAVTGAFLFGLTAKGETPVEVAACVAVMREHATHIHPRTKVPAMDLCGTGGARVKTYNASTVASFVVAGAGVPVAKHGNRSSTSPCGSADLLEALGADLSATPEQTQAAIETGGFGFMFAPNYHPAMHHVVPARKALGIRTVFNLLGPLSSPAGVTRQLLGVFDAKLVPVFAQVLKELGSERALVIHGAPGMDELSLSGTTTWALLDSGQVVEGTWNYHDLGLETPIDPVDFGPLEPAAAAAEARRILDGGSGPRTELIRATAAAALYASGVVPDLGKGLKTATAVLADGRGRNALDTYLASRQED